MEDTTPTVGLLADPGIPDRVATHIADDLAERTSREAGTRWQVEVSAEMLPLAPDGQIPLSEHAPELRREHGWDYVVYLTDLPLVMDQQPMLCEFSSETGAALIALPCLGGLRIEERTQELMMVLLRAATVPTADRPTPSAFEEALGGATMREVALPDSDFTTIVLTGRGAPLRLLGGMVRSNRPGSMLPALKGSMAAGVVTGAFGVFYGTIAQLADSLPALRLAVISVLVIGALSGWLIFSNNLWNRGRDRESAWRHVLDNISTIITVGVSTLLLYVALFVVMLIMSLVVVEAGYMEAQVGHPTTFREYVHLAWLAASLGVMAGALGSSFDSDDAVREATYSQRFHERRKMFGTYENRQKDKQQRQ